MKAGTLTAWRTIAPAVAAAAALTTMALAWPASAQQCRGTKEWFEGACRYPDEVAKLKQDQASQAAAVQRQAEAAHRRAEEERRKAEEERRKAEEERRKAEEERRKAEEARKSGEPGQDGPPTVEPAAVGQPTNPPGSVPAPGLANEPTATPPLGQTEGGGTWPLVPIGFAVAGTALVIGTITGAISMSQAADLGDRCPGDVCPPDIEGEVDTMMTLGHVSTASFVIAGVGAGVGLVGLLTGGSEGATESEGALRPLLGPGFVGLTGTF